MQISRQAAYFVDLEMQISWQYFVGFEVEISWQAQFFVDLEVQKFRGRQYFVDREMQIAWQAQFFVDLEVFCGRQYFVDLEMHFSCGPEHVPPTVVFHFSRASSLFPLVSLILAPKT